ncbi:MAG: GNAT family N-acetyltransferase [Thermoplasmata archaeon]
MNVRLGNGEMLVVKPAEEGYLQSYIELVRQLSKDGESYILVNYSGKVPSLEDTRQRASAWNRSDVTMHFATKAEDVVGYCGQRIGPSYGAELQPHLSEMWYAVSKDYRGTGLVYALMDESIRSRNVKYIQAYVDARNVRSMKLLERIGFRMLARLEENILDKKSGMLADYCFFRGAVDEILPHISRRISEKGISVLR